MAHSAIPAERWSVIEQELAAHEYVRTVDLVERLDVSVETVRRDLAVMESRGVLVRVRGGAVASGQKTRVESSYSERSQSGQREKAAIGRAAAAMVPDDSTVVIDVGTTALHVVRSLSTSFEGLLVTNSLPAATLASERLTCGVVVLGGRVRRGDLAVSGMRSHEFLQDFRPDVAFLGSGGISTSAGLTDFDYDEVHLRRVIIEVSAHAWVLADATKFGTVAPFRVGGFDDLAGVVTDQQPSAELRESIVAAGGDVIVGAP
ncbi:DeoR/GlpR family DNA-binding transcription regulator [Aeromicrobium phragmitis]|uniref:DeoR/GlpR family DNA-binding transcription regulator n=1 Tax=Aeromicrobium phragmitis TaxID=2478914 RepID=UPI0014078A30|nr:DeoR/GlpR family DNA-binding transcription regulator [Aeromicrobium phragmitis]